MMINKESERNRIKAKLETLNHSYRQKADYEINQELINFLISQKPQAIAIYLSKKSEVATDFIYDWLLKHHWEVYAPKIKGKEIAFYQLPKSKTELIWNDSFKIWEPPIRTEEKTDFAIMLVPIVGYNDSGYRLGHGFGYYDRWLAKHKVKLTIGLAYHNQAVHSHLIFTNDDIPLHRIITNKKGNDDKSKSKF